MGMWLSAMQMAEIKIELGWLARVSELGPVMDNVTVPTLYVLASGTPFGSHGDEQEWSHTGVNAVVERKPNIKISAKVASNYGAILKRTSAPSPSPMPSARLPPSTTGGAEYLTNGLTVRRTAG